MTIQKSSALTTVSFFKNPFLLFGGGVVLIGAGIIFLAPQINRGFQANAAAISGALQAWELCHLHGGKQMFFTLPKNYLQYGGVTCGFQNREGVLSLWTTEHWNKPVVIVGMEDPTLPSAQQR